MEVWVCSLQPRPKYDVLDRLERLSQHERPVLEYISDFDTVLAEMPLDIVLDDRLLFRTFRKGLDRALVILLAGHPEWVTYSVARTKIALLEEYAVVAGTYWPRSQKTKHPLVQGSAVAPAGVTKPPARPWQKGKQGSRPPPRGQKGEMCDSSAGSQRNHDRSAGACFHCHQKGHTRAQCPQLHKGPQAHAV